MTREEFEELLRAAVAAGFWTVNGRARAPVLAAFDELQREAYVPGSWICRLCGFFQEMLTLHAHTGAVAVNPEAPGACPNDGAAMQPLTWKEYARDLEKRLGELQREKEEKANG